LVKKIDKNDKRKKEEKKSFKRDTMGKIVDPTVPLPQIIKIVNEQGECVELTEPVTMIGTLDEWCSHLEAVMRDSLNKQVWTAFLDNDEANMNRWMTLYPT
jgi:hypothetical protein